MHVHQDCLQVRWEEHCILCEQGLDQLLTITTLLVEFEDGDDDIESMQIKEVPGQNLLCHFPSTDAKFQLLPLLFLALQAERIWL
jgi:hypothetical protein